MKVLFIGGTGTISTACTRLCIEQGLDLWLLVRGTRDYRIPSKAKTIHADFSNDLGLVKSLLDRHTWDCVVNWVTFDEKDVLNSFELFRGKTEKFVFISSTSVYSKPLLSPFVTESTPTGNRYWEYADQKARCERLLLDYHKTNGFPVVVVRPGHTYAEFALPSGFAGMGFGIVERILRGKPILVHGDGAGLWTMTYSEDFARALVPLMAMDSVVGEILQVTSDELLTWQQIYDLIGKAWEREVDYVFATSHLINQFDADLGATLLGDKAHSHIFVNSKLKRFLPSYSAQVPFEQGVLRCREWYRNHNGDFKIDTRRDKLMEAIIGYVENLEKVSP
jgi:nucleoside-diphosphate-sugar epimerase